MPNDFERRQEEAILNQIEDPIQKDVAFAGFRAKDCFNAARISFYAAACYGACAAILEAGDHAGAFVCYMGCTGFITFQSFRSFRKIWQEGSIPTKRFILSFFG